MRKIEIENYFTQDRNFAENFLEQNHRETKKSNPHTLMFTFNTGSITDEIFNRINYMLDLLTQASIIKNDTVKVLIDIDKRQKNYLNINVG